MDTTISASKRAALVRRMARLGIREEDLAEQFVLGAGPGGQKLNKTASCVMLRHRVSGLSVKCRKTRSRAANRYFARLALCEKLQQKIDFEQSARAARIARIRRQKQRRSRRQKERMLQEKKARSRQKQLRRPVRGEE